MVAEELFVLLTNGQIEIGIGPRPAGRSEFNFQMIKQGQYVAVVARGHPWAKRKSVSLTEFINEPILALLRGSYVREVLEAAMASQSLSLNPTYEVQHHFTLGGMVEAGLGVSALPSMAVSMLSQPLLRTVPIRKPTVVRDVGILKLGGKTLSPASRAFIDVFGEAVAQNP